MTRATDPIPDHVALYVDAIGEDATIELLLACGGSEIYLADKPVGSMVTRAIGEPATIELARKVGYGHIKLPIARRWIAAALFAKGKSKAEIARRVRVDVATVRRWFNDPNYGQGDLFADRSASSPAATANTSV